MGLSRRIQAAVFYLMAGVVPPPVLSLPVALSETGTLLHTGSGTTRGEIA